MNINSFEFFDDIANELGIEAEVLELQLTKYGLGGDRLDARNGIWFESKADHNLSDLIFRAWSRYDENKNWDRDKGYEDFGNAESDGIQVGQWGQPLRIAMRGDE